MEILTTLFQFLYKDAPPAPQVSVESTVVMILLLIVFCGGGALYFLPTILAATKKHSNKTAIILLNIFFGWSIAGWIILLVWATRKKQPQQPAIVNQATAVEYKFCTHCGVKYDASTANGVCPSCNQPV